MMHVVSRGSGQPVLFLHGIPTSCRLWDRVMDGMSSRFTCIAVDLPGLGRTATLPTGFRELDLIAAALEEVRIRCNVARWHVVGHDAGCAIAVHYAHRYCGHVDCLSLLSPSMFPDLKPFFLFDVLRKPVLGELAAPVINLLFWKVAMRLAVDQTAGYKEIVQDFHAPFGGLRGAWRLMTLLRWGKPVDVLAAIPEKLPQLAMPTLIFHGSQDRAIPKAFATRASSLIPSSSAIILNAGHFLPLDEPARIAAELRAFFATQTSRRENQPTGPKVKTHPAAASW